MNLIKYRLQQSPIAF